MGDKAFIIGDVTTQDFIVVHTDDIAIAVAKYAEIYGVDDASVAPIEQIDYDEQ